MSALIKYACLIAFLALSNTELADILFIQLRHTSIGKFLFYGGICLVFFSLFLFYAHRGKTGWRLIAYVPFLASGTAGYYFYLVTGHPITIDSLEISLLNYQLGWALVGETTGPAVQATMVGFLGLVGVAVNGPRIRLPATVRLLPGAIAAVMTIGLIAIVVLRSGYGMLGLPVQVTSLLPLPIALLDHNFDRQDRHMLTDGPRPPILLVIDESVAPDRLHQVIAMTETGLLPTPPGPGNNLVALKSARPFHALHNCSAQAVWSLVNGVTLQQDRLILAPSLWQRAKQAGYRVIYINAQERAGQNQYLHSPADIAAMDERHYFGQLPKPDRDQAAKQAALAALAQDEEKPAFILMIKNGSHFPYHNQIPRDYLADISLPDGTEEGAYLRSLYRNTVLFLDDLLNRLPLPAPVLYYLSDHGQDLTRQGFAHCNATDPAPHEWDIPLLILNAATGTDNWPVANTGLYAHIIANMGYRQKPGATDSAIAGDAMFYGSMNNRLSATIKRYGAEKP